MLTEEELEIRKEMEPIVDKFLTDKIKSYPSDEVFTDPMVLEIADACIDKLMEDFSLPYLTTMRIYDRREVIERFHQIDQVINKEKWDKAREDGIRYRRWHNYL